MAEVITAKTAGFCFGVKRAVDKAYELAGNGEGIYSFGPVIHNDEVVGDLESKGVKVLNDEEELMALEKGTVILRSHGVTKHVIDMLEKKGIGYIDVTCPFVKRIHDIVYEESNERDILIVGNPDHPEVQGIVGWCRGKAIVIKDAAEAADFKPVAGRGYCLVSQTTYNYKKFEEIVEIFKKKLYDTHYVNTICNATEKHQTEARDIASKVDMMIVIGDEKSSNSRKLFEICSEQCEHTYFIQTLKDLKLADDHQVGSVGITAGASTPKYIIEEVQDYVRNDI